MLLGIYVGLMQSVSQRLSPLGPFPNQALKVKGVDTRSMATVSWGIGFLVTMQQPELNRLAPIAFRIPRGSFRWVALPFEQVTAEGMLDTPPPKPLQEEPG